MTFTTLNLTGNRVLVKGQDHTGTEGEAVLDGSQWAEVKRQQAHAKAHDNFDSEVEAFFAPIVEAAELLESTLVVPAPDPASYVVIDEGEEGTGGRPAVVRHLHQHSIVLRLIEEGQSDRLVWVGGNLEILETLPVQVQVGGTPSDFGDES